MRAVHSTRRAADIGATAPRQRELCGRTRTGSNAHCAWIACMERMHRTLRALPSLDFLRGFEAAGRRLSFTLAAQELFLTQSALSRQIKALEDALGVPLFERRHRALALTTAGAAFHREISEILDTLANSAER